jgi:hypothetical protein
VFVVEWRLLIDQVIGFSDPGLSVYSDEAWSVTFDFDEDSVMDFGQPGLSAAFEPYAYHDFELRSSDMRSYELFIDGQPAMEGSFHHLISTSRVTWGDVIQGGASLARWDYFRFGVIPEPGALDLLLVSATVLLRRAPGARVAL